MLQFYHSPPWLLLMIKTEMIMVYDMSISILEQICVVIREPSSSITTEVAIRTRFHLFRGVICTRVTSPFLREVYLTCWSHCTQWSNETPIIAQRLGTLFLLHHHMHTQCLCWLRPHQQNNGRTKEGPFRNAPYIETSRCFSIHSINCSHLLLY